MLFKNISRQKELNLLKIILLFFFFLQIYFYNLTINTKAFIEVVPTPISKKTMKAFSLGDEQYYFRTNAYKIQIMGDTFGRNTPLFKYDYKKLYYWLKNISSFDINSNYLPSLGAYYFSQSQNRNDVIHIINYLNEFADYNLEKNWWWLYQAIYLSNYVYKDTNLSLKLIYKLNSIKSNNIPLWTKQLTSFILSEKGEMCEAVRILNEIGREIDNESLNNEEKIKILENKEIFIKNLTRKLKEKEFDIKKCYNK